MGEPATALQCLVLRKCHTWRLPGELDLRAPYHLLQRLVLLGWLDTRERRPQRVRKDRGQRRRWREYRTSERGQVVLRGCC